MKQVKLLTLKDGAKFVISKRSGVEWEVVQKVKRGITITALVSNRTTTKKANTLVWVI